jgi:hypothetical protein
VIYNDNKKDANGQELEENTRLTKKNMKCFGRHK